MAYRETLKNLGIELTGSFNLADSFKLFHATLGEVTYSKHENWNELKDPAQLLWSRPNHLKRYKHELGSAPWAHISSPTAYKDDVQKTVQAIRQLKNNPYVAIDLETTGLNINSELFNITEVAMTSVESFGGAKTKVIDLALAPDEQKAIKLRELINLAKKGESLAKDERYAIVSLIRYSGDSIDPVTRTVRSHSSLFTEELAVKPLPLTEAHFAEMESGLANLVSLGASPEEMWRQVKEQTADLKAKKVVLLGHNMAEFDLPALRGLGEDGLSSFLSSFESTETLDSLSMLRMVKGDPTKLYRDLIFEQIRKSEKYADQPMTRGLRREIMEEVKTRMRSLDGGFSMDNLRLLFDLASEGAHRASKDTDDLIKIVEQSYPVVSRLIEDKGVNIKHFGLTRDLEFYDFPMEQGMWYMAKKAQRATGFDISIDLPEEGQKQSYVSSWGITRGFHRFEGFFTDKIKSKDGKEQELYVAKFFNPEAKRFSFVTGGTPEELRKKLQQGNLRYLGKANPFEKDSSFARASDEILDDLARRRYDRWSDLSQKEGYGYSEMRRFLSALDKDEKLTTTQIRDLERLRPKLTAEKELLDTLHRGVEKANLAGEERALALSYFTKKMDHLYAEKFPEEAAAMGVRAAHSWEASVKIAGRNVSLGDYFEKNIEDILKSKVKKTALPEAQEKTMELLFPQLLKDVGEQYGLEKELARLIASGGSIYSKSQQLREILLNSEAVIKEINYKSILPRDLSFVNAEELAGEAVSYAMGVSRSFAGGSYDPRFLSSFMADHPHRKRMLSEVSKVIGAYEDAGFGVGLYESGGRLNMILNEGTQESISKTIKILEGLRGGGEVPEDSLVVEIPVLSKMGNIIYGREHKIGTAGFIGRRGERAPLYESVMETMAGSAYAAKKIAATSPDSTQVKRYIKNAVRDRFEKAAGVSRSSTFDRFEEAFRMDVRGNDADILRQYQVNITELADEMLKEGGKTWEDLGPYEKMRFLRTFKSEAQRLYPGADWVENIGILGIKDEKQLMQGAMSLKDARDFATFGLMTRSLRPNVEQWPNYYPYTTQELEERIKELGIKHISLNPLIAGRTEIDTYKRLSRPGQDLAKGVTIGALNIPAADLAEILKSERAQRIMRSYGLDPVEVIESLPGTWEQGAVLSPEMRGLLEGRQPSDFEISARDLEGGDWGEKVKQFLKEGKPVELSADDVLFNQAITAKGKTELISTLFGEAGAEQGLLKSVTEFTKEGEKYYRIGTELIFPSEDATKHMFDLRKMTSNYFGLIDKEEASSKALHEIFGSRVHMIYSSREVDRMDFSPNIIGRLRAVAEQLVDTEEGRTALQRELGAFGGIEITKLPGRDTWTFSIPDATELMKTTTPENMSRQASEIIRKLSTEFNLDLGDLVVGDKVYPRSVVELRRSLINEQKHIVDYTGKGLSQGHGMRITGRELASLKIKGEVMGVDMGPLLDYIIAEGREGPYADEAQTMASGMVKALSYLVDPEKTAEDVSAGRLRVLSAGEIDLLPAFKDRAWHAKNELLNTIVSQDEVFGLRLPEGFEYTIGKKGAATIHSDILPIAPQMLKAATLSGKVYLDNQAGALTAVHEAIQTYDSFDISDISHGRAKDREHAADSLNRAIQKYVDVLGHDLSFKQGKMADAMYFRLPSSGYVKAQNISVDLTGKAMKGSAVWSLEYAEKILGKPSEENKHLWDLLTSGEGFYGMMRRDPNQYSGAFVATNISLGTNMKGLAARISSVEAALLGADFDGDQYAALVAFSKRMLKSDPEEFFRIQNSLKAVYDKQSEYTSQVESIVREKYLKEPSKRLEDPLDYVKYLSEKLSPGGEYSLSEAMWGPVHEEQAMLARLSKGPAGSLYNLAHMYRETGLAVYGGVGTPEARRSLSLIDLYSQVTTEYLSLKGKHGDTPDPEHIVNLLRDFKRGKDLGKWAGMYSAAIKDETASLFYQGINIDYAGASEAKKRVLKSQMAEEMLQNLATLRQTGEASGWGKYFDYDSIASKMFFSEQAHNKYFKDLPGMYKNFYKIDPQDPEFMSSFVPTETWRLAAEKTGQGEAFALAEAQFKKNLRMAPATRLDGLVSEIAEEGTEKAAKQAVDQPSVVANLWNAIPKEVKFAAAGLGALYVVARGFSSLAPEEVPEDQPIQGPEGVVALNNPDESGTRGKKIKVKAQNLNDIDLGDVQDAVGRVVGHGKLSVYQHDNTRTLNNSWLQEMFTGAIKGRAR